MLAGSKKRMLSQTGICFFFAWLSCPPANFCRYCGLLEIIPDFFFAFLREC
jgi:hypothetical protein